MPALAFEGRQAGYPPARAMARTIFRTGPVILNAYRSVISPRTPVSTASRLAVDVDFLPGVATISLRWTYRTFIISVGWLESEGSRNRRSTSRGRTSARKRCHVRTGRSVFSHRAMRRNALLRPRKLTSYGQRHKPEGPAIRLRLSYERERGPFLGP